MLKKLKKKFVLINMCLAGAVLALVFLVVCFNIYSRAKEDVSGALRMAMDHVQGEMPEFMEIGRPPGERGEPGWDEADNYAAKPLHYRAVVALVTEEGGGQCITLQEEQDVSMDNDTMKQAVSQVMKKERVEGKLPDMDLFYRKEESAAATKIAFVDASYFNVMMKQTILTALILFLLGMAALLLISVWLARLAVEPAKRAWEQQRQFVADASHELKTPLTVLLANNEILLSSMEEGESSQRKWLESSREEAVHMKALIDDLLFLAQADEGAEGRQLIWEKMSLSELVTGAALQFEPIMFEKGISFDVQVEEGICMDCDGVQMRQLIHILLDNSVKYAGEKGGVLVSLLRKGGRLHLSVANTGEILSQEDLAHIFDRFYRSDKARSREGGYGLGLAIAKTIVESHGGVLTAESGFLEDVAGMGKSSGTVMKIVFS